MSKDQARSNVRMFVVPVDIFDVPDLSVYEKMAYIVIQSHTSARQNTAFPSYSTIAREGSMSRPSAIKAVQGLVEKGLLKKEIRLDVTKDRKIRNTSNLYTVELPSEVVNDVTTLVNDVTTPSKQGDHPGHVVYPNNNHLTKPTRTKPINNNKGISKKVTSAPKDVVSNNSLSVVVADLLSKHEIKVNKATLTKWSKLANEETILAAIHESTERPGVKNVVGYITKMLEAGYTAPVLGSTSAPSVKSRDLPDYVVKQIEAGKKEVGAAKEGLSEEQRKEAARLLAALGEDM